MEYATPDNTPGMGSVTAPSPDTYQAGEETDGSGDVFTTQTPWCNPNKDKWCSVLRYLKDPMEFDIERELEKAGRTLGESQYSVYTNTKGEKFWGDRGAGVLPICEKTKKVLINLRSRHVNEPNTYGVFGGAIDSGEESDKAALREFKEEVGSEYKGKIKLVKAALFRTDSFEYQNYIGLVDYEFEPVLDWESDGAEWVTLDEMMKLKPKWHFGLKYLWDNSNSLIKKFLR